MSDETTLTEDERTELEALRKDKADAVEAKKKGQGPPRFKVVLTHPNHHRRVVFSSVSEKRARQWIVNRFPRGSEAHLVAPDGTIEHYEHERQGENGIDADQWAPFDPSEWQAPEQAEPPGESAWADKEG